MEIDPKRQVVDEVREEAAQLGRLLDEFSGRLRRMRQRNRKVEEEIVAFEEELDRLRREVLDAAQD